VTREEALAGSIRDGVAAARDGRWSVAVDLLRGVADDADLASSPDLLDIRARVLAVLARSLVESGAPDEGLARAQQAIDAATRVGDVEELSDLKALREAARTAVASQRRTRLKTALPNPEAQPAGEARATAHCAHAEAALREGRLDDAVSSAAAALREAPPDCVKPRMLARLAWARARPSQAGPLLQEAWAEADRAGDTTWVAAVARAAHLAGIQLIV
jgi:hypothetical protein